MWQETSAVVEGIIRRQTQFASSPEEWIFSGPHIYVGNPLSKTPRETCRIPTDYDPIDLVDLPVDYLPRTNYVSVCDLDTYRSRTPRVPWDAEKRVTDFYRFVARRQLSHTGERTLFTAIAPVQAGHIHPVLSITFQDVAELVGFAGSCTSLPFDFLIRTTGKSDLYESVLRLLPLPAASLSLIIRTLLLNCVTSHYSALWRDCWQSTFFNERWSKADTRLDNARFTLLKPDWSWVTPLRTDYERRQAIIEIDVLVARALGRIPFPVVQQNERDTWYDRRGRIVFTCSKGLPDVGFPRSEWEKIRDTAYGIVPRKIADDALPGGLRERIIEYLAPFDRCDRESEYATAWKFFDEAGI